MELGEAINSTISGKEDRAGINPFDIWVSRTNSSLNADDNYKRDQILDAIAQRIEPSSEFWYFLDLSIQRLDIKNIGLSEQIRKLICTEDEGRLDNDLARYYALRAMGRSAEGLVPTDIDGEHSMRMQSPSLWLDLMLEAFGKGNSNVITNKIIELVHDINPMVSMKTIRSKLSEIREAYSDIPQFRSAMINIIGSLPNDESQNELLTAVNLRVGAMLQTIDPPRAVISATRVFSISDRTLKTESRLGQMFARPRQLEATG